jgi:hypothetical protein
LDRIGPEQASVARDGDVELPRIDQELHAEAGAETFDLPHPSRPLVLLFRFLGLKTRRDDAGDGREGKRG